MQVREILEGGSLDLTPEYLLIAQSIKEKKPTLPFRLNEKEICFDDYIIGELVLKDLSIKLKPRNEAFNLSNYLQIIYYLYELDKFSDLGTGFNEVSQNLSLRNLSKSFCEICNRLMQFGLTGTYFTQSEVSHKISGDIDFSEYQLQLIPVVGVPVFETNYSLDTPANQLIKLALNKLCLVDGETENLEKYQLLRNLTSVSPTTFTKDEAEAVMASFYSPNPWYLGAIDLSIKILFNLDLEYQNGTIEWLAFLENSNSIFESYIRKALQDNLNENVIKWDRPKPFSKLRGGALSGKKEYSPDILINFNPKTLSADAVLDVKNKTFEPTKCSSLDNIVSPSDLYQLIFYCNQLKTKVGALIYPSSTTNEPVEVMLDSEGELKLFIFSVDISANIYERNKKLAKQVYDKLLREV